MTVWEINPKVVDFCIFEENFFTEFSEIRDLQDGN